MPHHNKPTVRDIRRAEPEIVPETIGDESIVRDITRNGFETDPLLAPTRRNISGTVFGEFSGDNAIDRGLLPGIDQQQFRARNQSTLDQFGNFLNQAIIGEVVGGSIEGTGYLFDWAGIASQADGSQEEFGNWFSDIGKGLKTWTRDVTPIYEAEPGKFNMKDPGWWFGNGVSVASTLSLMIPAVGATKVTGLLGKGAKALANGVNLGNKLGRPIANSAEVIAKSAQQLATKFPKIAKLGQETGNFTSFMGESTLTAVYSRHMENMMEASQRFDEDLEQGVSQGLTHEQAKQKAAEGASFVYNNGWAMLMQDIVQYATLAKGIKTATAGSKNVVNALKTQGLSRSAQRAGSNIKPLIALDLASEGLEEGYQFVLQKEGKYLTDVKYGLTKPNAKFDDRLRAYSRDEEMWNAMFFGALGAGVVQTAGRPLKRAVESGVKAGARKLGTLTDNETLQTFGTERDLSDNERVDDILSRNKKLSFYTQKLEEANEVGDEDLIRQTKDEFENAVILNAVKNNNADNVIEWFQNIKKEQGLDDSNINIPELIAKTRKIDDAYARNLRNYGQFAFPITEYQLRLDEVKKEIPQTEGKIAALKTQIGNIENVSAVGRQLIDVRTAILGLERANKVRQFNKKYTSSEEELGKILEEENTANELIAELKEEVKRLSKEKRTKKEIKEDKLAAENAESLDELVKETSRLDLLKSSERGLTEDLTQLRDKKFRENAIEKSRVNSEVDTVLKDAVNAKPSEQLVAIDTAKDIIKDSKLSKEEKKNFTDSLDTAKEALNEGVAAEANVIAAKEKEGKLTTDQVKSLLNPENEDKVTQTEEELIANGYKLHASTLGFKVYINEAGDKVTLSTKEAKEAAKKISKKETKDLDETPDYVSEITDTEEQSKEFNELLGEIEEKKGESVPIKIAVNQQKKRENNDGVIVDEDGKRIVNNPEENLNFKALSDPNQLNVGDKVTFEIGTNKWFEETPIREDEVWKFVPIYVLNENGERIGILENGDKSSGGNRSKIYTNLKKGVTLEWYVQPVEVTGMGEFSHHNSVNNFATKYDSKGNRLFSSISETLGLQWEKQSDGKFELKNISPTIILAVGNPFIRGSEVRLELAAIPDNISEDLVATDVSKGYQQGQVWVAVMSPSGVYMPLKVSTAKLDDLAINKVLNAFEKESPQNIAKSIEEIVYTESDIDTAQGNDFFFRIVGGTEAIKIEFGKETDVITDVAIQFFDGNDIISVELDNYRKAIEGSGLTKVDIKEVEADGEVLVTTGSVEQYNIKKELSDFLAEKRYNVRKENINSEGEYISPVTEKVYPNYNAYLGANDETSAVPAILSTDVSNEDGNMFFDLSISLDNTNPLTKKDAVGSPTIIESEPESKPIQGKVIPTKNISIEDSRSSEEIQKEIDKLKTLDKVKIGRYDGINKDRLNRGREGVTLELQDAINKNTTFTKGALSKEQIKAVRDSLELFYKAVKINDLEHLIYRENNEIGGVREIIPIIQEFIDKLTDTSSNDLIGLEPPPGGVYRTTNEPSQNIINQEEGDKWLTDRGMNPEWFPEVKKLGDKIINGYVKKSVPYLWEFAEVGTEYHEAFHVVFRVWTSDIVRKKIFKEASARYNTTGLGKEEEEIVLEELLAENFRKFVLERKEPIFKSGTMAEIEKFFRKIWNYIQLYRGNRTQIDFFYNQIADNNIDKTFTRDLKDLNDETLFSLKDGFSSDAVAQTLDTINTLFVDKVNEVASKNRVISVGNIYFNVKNSFLVSSFSEKETGEAIGIEDALPLYGEIKDKSPTEQAKIINDKGYDFNDKTHLYLTIYEGWKTEVDTSDDFGNIKQIGWLQLAKEDLSKFGYSLSYKDDVIELEEKYDDETIFNRSHLEESHRDKISGDVRSFLSRIRGSETNIFGINTILPYEQVYAELSRAIVDTVSFGDMLENINVMAKKSPTLNSVKEALKGKYNDGRFIAQFYSNLALTNNKFQVVINDVVFDDNNKPSFVVRYLDSNTVRIEGELIKKWRATSRQKDSLYKVDSEGDLVADQTKLAELNRLYDIISEIRTPKAVVEDTHVDALVNYLNTIGIDITKDNLNTALEVGVNVNRRVIKGAELYSHIIGNETGTTSLSILHDSAEKGIDLYESDRGVVERVANIQKDFDESVNISFVNGEGKSVYPINTQTTFDREFDALKSYDPKWRGNKSDSQHKDYWYQYVDNFMRDRFYNPVPNDERYAALLINKSRNNKVFRQILDWKIFDAWKRKGEQTTKNTYSNMSEIESILNRYNGFLNTRNKKVMQIIAPSFGDRAKQVSVFMPRFSTKDKLKHSVYTGKFKDTVASLLKAQVLQDLARIQRANNEVKQGITYDNYTEGSKSALKWTQWEFLNNSRKYPEAKALIEFVTSDDNLQMIQLADNQDANIDKVIEYITEYLDGQVESEIAVFDRLKIDKEGSNQLDNIWKKWYDNNKTEFIKDFVYTNTIMQNEIKKVTIGDPAAFKSTDSMFKRYTLLQTPGIETFEKSMWPDTNYGNKTTYMTAVLNDQFVKGRLNSLKGRSKELDSIIELYNTANNNKGSNIADAMAFTSLDKHRADMQGQGMWTDKHDNAYSNYISGKIGKRQFVTTKDTSKNIKAGELPLLSPIKTITVGLVFNEDLERYVLNIDKHAKFPLLDDFTKNNKFFDALKQRMEATGEFSELTPIDEVNMESGRKAGATGNINLNVKNDVNIEGLKDWKLTELPTKIQRIPQVNNEVNRAARWGSQVRKQIIANIQEDSTYVVGGVSMKGSKLLETYHNTISTIVDKNKKELFSQLKYDDYLISQDSDNSNIRKEGKLNFLKGVRRLLNREIESRDLPNNYREALKIIEGDTGVEFETPLVFPAYQNRFEQALLSIFKKKIINIEMNGKAMIQIAELGGHVIDNSLKFIDKDGYTEIAIPHELAVILRLPKTADGEFDLTNIPDDILKLVGYRIPTTDKNSIRPLKIVRVLPKNLGKVILVPGEITTQMGSDFDVDKLYLMMPNYEVSYKEKGVSRTSFSIYRSALKEPYGLTDNEIRMLVDDHKNADYIQTDDPTTFGIDVSIINDKIKSFNANNVTKVEKVPYNAKKLADNDIRGLENLIIDIYEGVLISKHHDVEMLRPTESDTLPDAIKLLEKANRDLDPQATATEREFEKRAKMGTTGIGFYANASTGQAIGQYIPLNLSDNYAFRLDGEIYTSLHEVKDKTGSFITYNFTELLTSAVDNLTRDEMTPLNDNMLTAPITSLILRTGAVNKNYEGWKDNANNLAIIFRNQPIILELTEQYNNTNANISELATLVDKIGKSYDPSYDLFVEYNNMKTVNMNTATLVDSLKTSKEKIIADDNLLRSQLDALTNFYLLHAAGRMLVKTNKVLNSDRVRDLNNIAGIEQFEDVIDNVDDRGRNPYITGIEAVLYGGAYPTTTTYLDIIDTIKEFSQIFFPYTSEAMRLAKDDIRTALNKESLTKETYEHINKYAFLWLASVPEVSPFGHIFNGTKINELFKGDNPIDVRLENIKTYIENNNLDRLKKNKLLQRLSAHERNYKDDKKINVLYFNNSFSMTKFGKDELTENFNELIYHSDPVIKAFGKDLLEYTILSTGFNTGVNSLIEYIPNDVWNDPSIGSTSESLSEYFRSTVNNFDKLENFGYDFIENFIENNSHISGLIPRARGVRNTSSEASFQDKLVLDRLADHYTEYVIQYDRSIKEDVLFKHVTGQNNRYRRINKKGVPFFLREVHTIDSVVNTRYENLSDEDVEYQRLNTATDILTSATAIRELGDRLSKRTGIEIKYINDPDQIYKGKVSKSGIATVNLAFATLDTPIHEILGHPIIAEIQKTKPGLYNNLITELNNSVQGVDTLARVKVKYPNYTIEQQEREALVQVLGNVSAIKVVNKKLGSLLERLYNEIKKIFRSIFKKEGIRVADLSDNITIDELSDIFIGNDIIKIDISSLEEEFQLTVSQRKQLESKNYRELDKESKLLTDIITTLRIKLKRLKAREDTNSSEVLKVINALDRRLKTGNAKQGLVDAIRYGEAKTRSALQTTEDFEKKLNGAKTNEEKHKIYKKIIKSYQTITYYDIFEKVYGTLKGETIEKSTLGTITIDDKFNTTYISPIISRISEVKRIYLKLAKQVSGDILYAENNDPSLSREEFDRMLQYTNDDVGILARWAGGMAESPDTVLALVDRIISIRRADINKNIVEFKNTTFKRAIKELETFQKAKGINILNSAKLFDFMIEKNDQGQMTFNYLRPDKLEAKGITKDDPRYKFAKMFDDAYFAHQKKLFMTDRNGNQLISIIKSAEERLFEGQNLGKIARETFEEAFKKRIDDTDFVEVATDENGNEFKFVPTRHTQDIRQLIDAGTLRTSDISLDMGTSLLRYMTMARNFEAMQQVVPDLEAIKDLVAERDVAIKQGDLIKIIKGTNVPIPKKGKDSRAFGQLDDYLSSQVFGERKKDQGAWNILGRVIDKRKAADVLAKYTSYNNLALNLYSGINNLTIAQVMNAIEGSGGQFYRSKDYRFAYKEYLANLPALMNDAVKRFDSSLLGIWADTYDLFQTFDETGQPIKANNFIKRIGLDSTFFMLEGGEHMIQTQLAIATAKGHRIYKGNILSYDEWVVATNNKFDKDSRTKFDALPDLYSNLILKDNKVTTKIPINEGQMVDFMERVKGIYARNHGNYSRKDSAALQRGALGMFVMMHKKWMEPGIKRRFQASTFDGRDTFDQRLRANIAGNYTITKEYIQDVIKEANTLGGMFTAFGGQFKELPRWKQQAIYRTVAELAYMAGSMVIIWALSAFGDDDEEKNWAFHMAEYQAYRLKSELFFYVSPTEALRIVRSPAAALNMLEKTSKVMYQLVPLAGYDRYKIGDKKGDLKLASYATDVVPLWNQIERLTPESMSDNASWMKR